MPPSVVAHDILTYPFPRISGPELWCALRMDRRLADHDPPLHGVCPEEAGARVAAVEAGYAGVGL